MELLGEIMGNESTQMRYKDFWPKIVRRYKVEITGWPSDIPFKDLSEGSRSLSDLESLLRKWKNGTVHWKKLTDEEYTRRENDRDERIERGEITVRKRQSRSDAGTKRRSYSGSTQARKKARTTSGAVIQPSDDESGNSDDNTDVPTNSTAGTAAPPPRSGTAGSTTPPPSSSLIPSPLGDVSSTSTLSLDTVTTPITCSTIPSASATAAVVIPTDTSNNPDMFHDRFNIGGDATSGFDDIFTGFHHNDLDSLFFNFDFDEATSNMTF
jgi:hypothetical protein